MRWPSDNLMSLLTELQVCNRDDIAACEAKVRRLCHDLPDFDSVWLDALVQNRVLTPWQSDILSSGNPHQLRVDEFLKCEPLGNSTYRARSTVTGRLVTLQSIAVPAEATVQSTSLRMFSLLERLDEIRTGAPQAIELPRRVIDDSVQGLFFVNSYMPGWTAEGLLIRGGRIPWPVVAEIGRQLLVSLQWMEQHNLLHGDVSLRNVRLQPDGHAVLVGGLVSEFTRPLRSFSANLKLRDVQTVAPELIGTGARADNRSDLYSLGCVLWQLLTARSAFLATDPIAKVLKSQEKDVADVRTLVPDCPEWMARAIQCFTRRTPELRPDSIHSATESWLLHSRSAVPNSKRLLRRMPDHSAQQRSAPKSRTPMTQQFAPIAAAVLMVLMFTAYGINRGLLPQTLMLGGAPTPLSTAQNAQTASLDAAKNELVEITDLESPGQVDLPTAPNGLLAIPKPDAAGVVVLQSGQTYAASDLNFAGTLHVETSDELTAVVSVDAGHAWNLNAAQIVLRNVRVNVIGQSDQRQAQTAVSVNCRCDVLTINHCVIGSAGLSSGDSCVNWAPASAVVSVVSVADTVFHGSGYGLRLKQSPNRCRLENVLMATSGVGICCEVGSLSEAIVAMDMQRVTLVRGRGLLDVVMEAAAPDQLRIEVRCGESVFVPSSSLVRIAGPDGWSRSNAFVEFLLPERGNPTIIPPDIYPATFLDRGLKSLVSLDQNQLTVESLLIASPAFRAADGGAAANVTNVADFELVDYEGPKLSPVLPGIDASRLPQDSFSD